MLALPGNELLHLGRGDEEDRLEESWIPGRRCQSVISIAKSIIIFCHRLDATTPYLAPTTAILPPPSPPHMYPGGVGLVVNSAVYALLLGIEQLQWRQNRLLWRLRSKIFLWMGFKKRLSQLIQRPLRGWLAGPRRISQASLSLTRS